MSTAFQNYQMYGGGSGMVYNPLIGNNPLPAGTQGTSNRAYTHTPQQNEMVSHQMNGLLQSDSPYIRNARQRANEASAGRGLRNSSLAMGNAERAAIESALPIASQDAARYGQSAESNLGYLNQMNQLEAQLNNQSRISADGNAAQLTAASMAADNALLRQRENLAFTGEQAGLDRAHQLGRDQFGLGADLTRMGGNAQWANWLGGQENIRGMERDLYGTQLGVVQGFAGSMNRVFENAIASGMLGPDFMANPQQMTNLIGGISQMAMPFFNNFFSQMFGGQGGP